MCTLLALYEVFKTLLYKRLYSKLDRRQPPGQGEFRRSHQTLDHLATYRLLGQRCREWRVKMWIATVDFAKAFDTMKAFARFEVETPYVSLLKKEAPRRTASHGFEWESVCVMCSRHQGGRSRATP